MILHLSAVVLQIKLLNLKNIFFTLTSVKKNGKKVRLDKTIGNNCSIQYIYILTVISA